MSVNLNGDDIRRLGKLHAAASDLLDPAAEDARQSSVTVLAAGSVLVARWDADGNVLVEVTQAGQGSESDG